MIKISVRNLNKSYAGNPVLKEINFDIVEGEFLAILGASGCGKTTLIRSLIGLEPLDSGTIEKDHEDITMLEPSKRGMGIVFQDYGLFPNMTVLQNVMYPLKFNKDRKKNAKKVAIDLLQKVGLIEYIDRKPYQLSGGQQQRVAIARTLALSHDVILFDEPMSALDVSNRDNLRKELKRLQKQLGITMIYITHDQEEAFMLADRIMVMQEGRILQLDVPREIYENPINQYVESFVTNHLKEKMLSLAGSVGKV